MRMNLGENEAVIGANSAIKIGYVGLIIILGLMALVFLTSDSRKVVAPPAVAATPPIMPVFEELWLDAMKPLLLLNTTMLRRNMPGKVDGEEEVHVSDDIKPKEVKAKPADICRGKGKRYFKRKGHKVWKCKR